MVKHINTGKNSELCTPSPLVPLSLCLSLSSHFLDEVSRTDVIAPLGKVGENCANLGCLESVKFLDRSRKRLLISQQAVGEFS